MGQSIEELKSDIICYFPGLAEDDDFKITSPDTPDYNCIAWAFGGYKDKWIQPPSYTRPPYDAIVWWPDDVAEGLEIDYLVELFESKGFKKCADWKHEDGYQKVALYIKDGNWTHASRELVDKKVCGKWISKLGPMNDIQHGTPYTIEGDCYGEVYCIMKREFK